MRLIDVVTMLRDLEADVEQLDKELTVQTTEVALHGAAIKQLLEEHKLQRDHGWQIKALIATVLATNAAQLAGSLLVIRH